MKTFAALALSLALGAALAAAAVEQAAAQPGRCFRMSQMHGWKPLPDASGMYFRVGLRDVWVAHFSGACPMIRRPGVHLVNKVSNDMICSPIEFDVRVGDNIPGFAPIPCIVSDYHQLSPAEAAALPPKLRP
jgi:hypothetical protein